MQAGGRRCVFLGLPVPAGSRVDAKVGRVECAYGRPVPEDSQVDTLHSADRSLVCVSECSRRAVRAWLAVLEVLQCPLDSWRGLHPGSAAR